MFPDLCTLNYLLIHLFATYLGSPSTVLDQPVLQGIGVEEFDQKTRCTSQVVHLTVLNGAKLPSKVTSISTKVLHNYIIVYQLSEFAWEEQIILNIREASQQRISWRLSQVEASTKNIQKVSTSLGYSARRAMDSGLNARAIPILANCIFKD